MHPPVIEALSTHVGEAKKRIFVLTDGYANDSNFVIRELTSRFSGKYEDRNDTKVFAFGISNDCDKELVTKIAKLGRGCEKLIGDNDMSFIKEAVMNCLKRSMAKTKNDCTFDFGTNSKYGFNNGELELPSHYDLGTLYENEI